MNPAVSARNLTPSSIPCAIAWASSALLTRKVGTVSGGQIVHGHTTGADVVKDHVTLAVIVSPAALRRPPGPP